MSGISTHVLDTARGRPADGVPVALARRHPAGNDDTGDDAGDARWEPVAAAATDADGRVAALLPPGTPLLAGTYRLTFDTGAYFHRLGVDSFYPEAAVVFAVRDAGQHFHVPLLLNPFGYTTYRGS